MKKTNWLSVQRLPTPSKQERRQGAYSTHKFVFPSTLLMHLLHRAAAPPKDKQ